LSAASEFSAERPAARIGYRPLATRLLHLLLFVAILGSPFVFIEPSPYEVFVGLLALGALAAGVTIDRKIMPPLFLLLIWNVSGLVSLLPVLYDHEAVTFVAISFYMAMTVIVFACLFANDSVRRLEIMRTAYILAGLIAAIIGIVGYFNLVPGAWENLTLYNRAKGTFKDPNVFGPYLILPVLFVIQGILIKGLKLRYIAVALTILVALLLSFSRAAWAHFVFSAALMVALMFVASPSARFRARIASFSVLTAVGIGVLLAGMLSVGTIGDVFKQRASLTQDYDVGDSGRFTQQENSIPVLLERPNGLGPYQFHKYYGQDPHEVYLNAFASYGWVGGFSYAILVLFTLWAGYANVLKRTPWQPYFIASLATYTGVALEGFVIDTDHWRHYYLLMGIIWGLVIATLNAERAASRFIYQRRG
jgi:O-antigen ligase